jgi:lipoprotein-releasing system ATP-binding protein
VASSILAPVLLSNESTCCGEARILSKIDLHCLDRPASGTLRERAMNREDSHAEGGLQVRDVYKSFQLGATTVEVLKGASLTLEATGALVLMGPSGSGKSTLLHLIGGLDTPTSGQIEIDGQESSSMSEDGLARFRNSTIGFVFQDSHLLPQYTVLENVLLPALAFPNRPQDSAAWARELLDRVGLSARLDHRPAELSGGERQRVAVARALINRPRLLLCDEPTGSLDAATAESIASLLFQLHAQEKSMLLVVTHSAELASRFDQRLELREGRCIEA